MTSANIPRNVMETVKMETSEGGRSVILDQKDNSFLVLDDLEKDGLINPIELPVSMAGGGAKIININGTQHIITNASRPAPRIPFSGASSVWRAISARTSALPTTGAIRSSSRSATTARASNAT